MILLHRKTHRVVEFAKSFKKLQQSHIAAKSQTCDLPKIKLSSLSFLAGSTSMSCQDRQTNAAVILNIDFANQTCCEPLNLFFFRVQVGSIAVQLVFITSLRQKCSQRCVDRVKNFSTIPIVLLCVSSIELCTNSLYMCTSVECTFSDTKIELT